MFSANDVKEYEKLEKLLTDKALWSQLSSMEVIKLYQSLVWLAGLKSKIEANIMEINKVTQVTEPTKD